MYLTDEELCMIEQLAYLDEAVAKVAGINKIFSKTQNYRWFRINDCRKLRWW